MTADGVPTIFSDARRAARALRAAQRQRTATNPAAFLLGEMADDMIDRLSFVRHAPQSALLIGVGMERIAAHLQSGGSAVDAQLTVNPYAPLAGAPWDFIGVNGDLDAVNDLPGMLIQLRHALAPGGLAIASFIGGQSLPALRAAMLAAEPDRPAARAHPLVDARAAPGLLQRAGWKDPVVDTYTMAVRYSSLDTLVSDLRDQGLGNALAKPAAPLGRAALARARTAFAARAGADGKVTETFEIITLTGRRSLAGT